MNRGQTRNVRNAYQCTWNLVDRIPVRQHGLVKAVLYRSAASRSSSLCPLVSVGWAHLIAAKPVYQLFTIATATRCFHGARSGVSATACYDPVAAAGQMTQRV